MCVRASVQLCESTKGVLTIFNRFYINNLPNKVAALHLPDVNKVTLRLRERMWHLFVGGLMQYYKIPRYIEVFEASSIIVVVLQCFNFFS